MTSSVVSGTVPVTAIVVVSGSSGARTSFWLTSRNVVAPDVWACAGTGVSAVPTSAAATAASHPRLTTGSRGRSRGR